MANFNTAIEKILKHEGGYSNRSTDAGGETYRGISRPNHPEWIGWSAVDVAKKTNGGSLPNNYIINSPTLEAQAKQLYKTKFWDKIQGDTIKDQAVAEILFDARLNQTGGFYAMLNNALHLSGKKDFKYIDKVSPNTSSTVNTTKALTAVNDTSAQKIYTNFKDEREKYYISRGQPANIKGWLSRLSSFDYYKKNPKVAIGAILIIAGLTALSLYFIHRKK
jgi:lysozyme family protein